MKKIGQGWQFKVYDGGDFVEKVPTSPWEIRLKMLRYHPQFMFKLGQLEAKVRRLIAERDAVIEQLHHRDVDLDLLADLWIADGKIQQNKVTPLGEALRQGADGKALIDAYIDHTLRCWRNGFAETSYNFTVNHGLDESGACVILDFGEISFEKAEVRQDIQTRLWEGAWSCTTDLDPKLSAYCVAQMNTRLTEDALDRLWKMAPSAQPSHPGERAPDRRPQAGSSQRRRRISERPRGWQAR